MSLLDLKNAFITPLEATIKQQELATLGQFNSLSDLQIQWGMLNGYKNAIKHFTNVYENVINKTYTDQSSDKDSIIEGEVEI